MQVQCIKTAFSSFDHKLMDLVSFSHGILIDFTLSTFRALIVISLVARSTAAPVRVLAAHLADGVAVGIGLVVDLVGRVADVLLVVFGPVQVLVAELRRRLDIAAHKHAVNHRADERGKAEDQEDDSENPAKGKQARARHANLLLDTRRYDQLQSCTHHTNSGSTNWMTMTKPNVMRIRPRLMSSMRQQTPRMFGQKGFGAVIASTLAPMRLDDWTLRPERPVLRLLATE
jgi:hypothetical protein